MMAFADRMIYYMSQVYDKQSVASPPANQESWDAAETLLAYYLTRGYRFT